MKVKSKTDDKEERKIIVNDPASKSFNKEITKLNNESNKLWNSEKNEFRS